MKTRFNTTALGAILGAMAFAGAAQAECDGKFGGTLTVAGPLPLITLDHMMITNEPTPPRSAVYEQLVALDSNLVSQPALATSWETSEDGLTWTFKLREGVTFHNGKPLVAEDVVASWERYKEVGSRRFELASVDRVEAVDDGTVAIHLTKRYGALLESISAMSGGWSIMPAEIARELGTTRADLAEQVVGTGPYMVHEIVPEVRTTLRRFDGYTRMEGEPSFNAGPRCAYFDEVTYVHIADPSTRVSALLAGEVDFAVQVPGDEAARLIAAPNTQVIPTRPGNRVYYKFNVAQGVFADYPLLRDAVRAGLDTEELMAGFGPSDYWRVNNTPRFQEPQWPWVDQSHHYPKDMDLAKKLVAESGYKNEEIRFLVVPGGATGWEKAPAMDQYLRDLGLNVRMENLDGATFGTLRRDLSAWELKGAGGGSLVGLRYLDSSGVDRNGNPWPNLPEGWTEVLDRAINADSEEGRAAAAAEFYELQAKFNNEMWTGDVFVIMAANTNLRNIASDDSNGSFWNVWRDE
ncbi:MAG: ABC transporter substrate-binding protein [Pseudorhodobacter sp.]